MRITKDYECLITDSLKRNILLWAQQYEDIVWLDSNNYKQEHQTYKAILAVDGFTSIKTDFQNAFRDLKEYQSQTRDWLFGYLTYDLKNDVERLESKNFDGLDFADLYFFQPKKVFLFTESQVSIRYLNMVDDELEGDWDEIVNYEDKSEKLSPEAVKISLRTSKDSYFDKNIRYQIRLLNL